MRSLSFFLTAWILTACAGGVANQGTPTGTLVDTGTLGGQNGATVSGSVSLYSQGNGAYAVQIAGLTYTNSPCSSSTMVGVISGGYTGAAPLLGTGGSYNYFFYNLSTQPSGVILYCNGASPINAGITAQTNSWNPA